MSQKKYVSLSKLQTFLENLNNKFASKIHTHKVSDLTDYAVDNALSADSTNPVQNTVINAEFDAVSQAMGALDLAVDGKADLVHIHPYGVCSSSSTYTTKTVTVENFSLVEGVRVIVKFTNANKASSPKLNVNGTGAIPIMCYGETAVGSNIETNSWEAGAILAFTYDGTNWVRDYWYNTTYSNIELGQGYGYCYTSYSTAEKEVSMSDYELKTGGIVSVKFTYSVDEGATMNINGQGAKSVYYKGSSIVDEVIKGGDTATFIYYASTYHLISVDRWHEDIAELQAVSEKVRQIPATANGNFKLLFTPVFQSEEATAYTYFDNDVYLNPYYNKIYGVDISGTATGIKGVTSGNFLVGNGSDKMTEKTPSEVLSMINGASVRTMTTAEYEGMDDSEFNANTLYMLTDSEETSVLYTEQSLTEEQQAQARTNIGITDIITPDMIMEMMNETGAAQPIADADNYVLTTDDNRILIL